MKRFVFLAAVISGTTAFNSQPAFNQPYLQSRPDGAFYTR